MVGCSDCQSNALGGIRSQIGHNNGGTLAGVSMSDRFPEARTGARYDGDKAVEPARWGGRHFAV